MVHIIGAGCGAADLITLRGKKYLELADVIIYAGSLVNRELLKYAKDGCALYDSAKMTLEEILAVIEAAEALKTEYTLPDVSQTVIITRASGKTNVPESENLKSLAYHGATMVLFLSTGLLSKVTEELIAGGYAPDSPAAIVYKASWEDEKICRCTVGTLERTAKENNITKTALITVGGFLDSDFSRSHLYDTKYPTEYREASK